MRLCGACGDGKPKTNATTEEIKFLGAAKKLCKADRKYQAAPFMKGSEPRKAIGATLTALAYDALDRDPDAGMLLALESRHAPIVRAPVPTTYTVPAAPGIDPDRAARLTAIAERLSSDVSFDTYAVWDYLQGAPQPDDQTFSETEVSGELKMLRTHVSGSGASSGSASATGRSPFLRTPPEHAGAPVHAAPRSALAGARAASLAPAPNAMPHELTPELPSTVRVHRKTKMLHTPQSLQ